MLALRGFALVCLASVACSDGGGAVDAPGADARLPDAGGLDASATDAEPGCSALAEYGELGPLGGEAFGSANDIAYRAPLADGDVLVVELFEGFGVFEGSVAPGTYTLAGDELAYDTCGACVYLETDVDETGAELDVYFATGGTLTVDEVGGAFEGTLTGATFQHAIIHPATFETTLVDDGCLSGLGAASWDLPVIQE